MVTNYDIKKINAILQDFYNATGINIDLLKEDFSPPGTNKRPPNNYCGAIHSTEKGKLSCLKSDRLLLEKCKKSKKPEMHICHAGLIDIAVPLIHDDFIIGYIILGQMKQETDFSKIADRISHLPTTTAKMEIYYSQLSYFDVEKINSIINIASMLAKHILLENMLNPRHVANLERAKTFIEENLEKPFTIKDLCDNINISKSVLYKTFHSHFGCTVNDYVKIKRIEQSMKLLKETDLSIEEISQRVGFSSTSYYSRIFKGITGISPLRFRKH